MSSGYVARNKQLQAAVSEAERINRPVICWPEDVGHITPADLPLIDLKIAEREFAVIERQWLRDDEPLCLPTPGKAYAVVNRKRGLMNDRSEVVTFRVKTVDECKCDEDRESNLYTLIRVQDELIVHLGYLIAAIADRFIHPDISYLDYPEINDLLDTGSAINEAVQTQYGKVFGNGRVAGKAA